MNKEFFNLLINDNTHTSDEVEFAFMKGQERSDDEFQFVDNNERGNAQVVSRLRMLKVTNEVSEEVFRRAVSKVTDFIYAMEESFSLQEESFDYETIIEDSIVVKFSSHPKMRLNIFKHAMVRHSDQYMMI